MDRVYEIMAIILPTLVLGYLLGRRSQESKISDLTVQRNMAMIRESEDGTIKKIGADLSDRSDIDLIQSAIARGAEGAEAKPGSNKKPG